MARAEINMEALRKKIYDQGVVIIEAAIAEAVAAERARLLAMVRGSCACGSCKRDIAAMISGQPSSPDSDGLEPRYEPESTKWGGDA